MYQPRKGDSLQELSEEREQSFKSMSQVVHTYQVNKSVSKLSGGRPSRTTRP